MKKGKILLAFAAVLGLGLLTACTKPAAQISVKSGTYVLEDGKTYSSSTGYLALDVSVKNTSGKTMSNLYEDSFTLYDSKNNQIKAENVYAPDDSKFTTLQSTSLSPDKTLNAEVVYQVDKGQKYTLHFNANSYDKSSKDIVVKVDTKKYKDPSAGLKSMAKSYIDTVFLGEKGEKSSLKNDLTKAHSDFEAAFTKDFTDSISTYYTPSAAEVAPTLSAIETTNAKKGSVDYTIDAMFPDYAVVNVNPKLVDLSSVDLDATMTTWENANQGKFDDYDAAESAAFKYALQQLPGLINSTTPSAPKYMDNGGYKLILKKDASGKWSVDNSTTESSNYDFKDLQTAFMGGSDYSY